MTKLRRYCEAVANGKHDPVYPDGPVPATAVLRWTVQHFCFTRILTSEQPFLGRLDTVRSAREAPIEELDEILYLITAHHPVDLPLEECTKVDLSGANPFFRNGGVIVNNLDHLRKNTIGIIIAGFRETGKINCDTLFCEHEADAVIASELVRNIDWLK